MQRNKLIKNIKDGKSNKIELEFWDSRLSEEGSSIFFERNSILKKLMKNSKQLANELNKSIEMEIYYTPRIGSNESSEIFNENPTVQDIKDLYTKAIEKNYQRDLDQRTTLLGPHRDDFIINFNETIASSSASRGQSRIMSLALKLSEAEEIINLTNKKPILILDDIFSELDQKIRNNIIKKIKKFEQVLISTADMNLIDKKSIEESNIYSIKNGKVSKE
jgi:DNA replication and repair protein RecF